MTRAASLGAGLAALALLLAAPAAAETLLVGNKGEDSVSFIDLASGRERARVATGHAPHEIAVSPDGRQAAVVAYGGTTIDIFDVAAARLVRRIDLAPAAAPHGIAWLRGGRLVVAAEKSRSVEIVDPAAGRVASIPTGGEGTHMIAVSRDERRAYVANIRSGTIGIVDLRRRRMIGDIALGGAPEGLALSRNGRELWVGDDAGPRLRVVDVARRRVSATLPTGPVPIRVAISPDGRTAVTSNFAAGTLSLFDVAARRPLRTITVSGDRRAQQVTILFSRDGRRLYVAETGRNEVAEVDMAAGTVLRRIPAGRYGDGLAIAR